MHPMSVWSPSISATRRKRGLRRPDRTAWWSGHDHRALVDFSFLLQAFELALQEFQLRGAHSFCGLRCWRAASERGYPPNSAPTAFA